MDYKNCAKCEESLPVTCFWKDDRRKDGLRPYCKACQADLQREWRYNAGRTKEPRIPDWDCSK